MAPIAVRRAPSGLGGSRKATGREGRSESTNVAFLITRLGRHRTTHDGVEDFPQEVMAYVAHTHHFHELRPRCPETAAGSIPSLQRIFRMWIENRQLVRLQRIQGTLRVLQGLRNNRRMNESSAERNDSLPSRQRSDEYAEANPRLIGRIETGRIVVTSECETGSCPNSRACSELVFSLSHQPSAISSQPSAVSHQQSARSRNKTFWLTAES